MKKILVIDDERPIRELLKIALTEKGYDTYQAMNGDQGLLLFKEQKPDITITDVKMPGISGLEVTKKIKNVDKTADVIIMTGYGTEEMVIESIRAGASNYLKKPLSLAELFNILENILQKRENQKRSEVIKDVVEYEQKKLVIGNEISRVWGIINQLLFNIQAREDRKLVEGIRIGLYEVIVNAIEHGNLEITYEEKSSAIEKNSYSRLIDKKLKQADSQGKKVIINSIYSGDKLEIEVSDQGKGFNFKELPALRDPESIFSAHGRGILLASLYFDQIEYKEPGNRVILVKNFPK